MISIDTVYQRVLAMANKEQRGYITPQEFNLLANQAQMQIFESYFYTKNRREKIDADRKKGNDSDSTTETDITELMTKNLKPFLTTEQLVIQPGNTGFIFPTTINNNEVFQTGRIYLNARAARYVHPTEAARMISSARHIAAGTDPFWTESHFDTTDILVYNPSVSQSSTTATCDVECIVRPSPFAWAYVVMNEKALYNSYLSVDFLLHISEEDTLVNKILELAGIIMNKTGLIQVAANKDQSETQIQNT